jgi:hypothetical protein
MPTYPQEMKTMMKFWFATDPKRNGDTETLTSEASGVVLTATPQGDTLSYVMTAPAFPGEEATTFTSTDAPAVRSAYLERHLRWIAATVGEGFVAGANADEYGSVEAGLGLPENVQTVYDDIMGEIHDDFSDWRIKDIVADALTKIGQDPDRPFLATAVSKDDHDVTHYRNDVVGVDITETELVTGTTYRMEAKSFAGEDAFVLNTDDVDLMQAAYAERWMRYASATIGTGFHPDTPAAGYAMHDAATGISVEGIGETDAPLLRQYDVMIGYCHDHLEDPYEYSMDAWEKAGHLEEANATHDASITPA